MERIDLAEVISDREVASATGDVIIDTIAEFGAAIAEGIDGDFRLDAEENARYLFDYRNRVVPGINETTRRQLQEAIDEGIALDETLPELEARVRDVMTQARSVRAPMIGRTETVRASNFASIVAGVQNNLKMKRWATQKDEKVRPKHRAMEGQTVPYDGYFTSPDGEKAKWPGQFPSASNSVNCRCAAIPMARKVREELSRSLKSDDMVATFDRLRAPFEGRLQALMNGVLLQQETRVIEELRRAFAPRPVAPKRVSVTATGRRRALPQPELHVSGVPVQSGGAVMAGRFDAWAFLAGVLAENELREQREAQ